MLNQLLKNRLNDLITPEKQHTLTSNKIIEKEKNRFELTLDESIAQQVDLLMQEENDPQNKLLTPTAYRAKYENELYKSLNFNEFKKHIFLAINILKNEGLNYLTKIEHEALIEDLNNLKLQLEHLKINQVGESSLKEVSSFSENSLFSILKIGIAKFTERILPDSLAVFIFLSTLDDKNFDYAYRLALIAQKNGRDDLALRAFIVASQLNPEFIGAHIFAAQSYLNCNQRENALIELSKAKNMLKIKEVEEEWHGLIADVENLIFP